MLKYSIIIPHFNDTKRLTRLLRSIPLNRSDIEVIVIDDCSPNYNELKFFGDRNGIKLFSTTTNSGAGAARNIGISKAEGIYLVFADTDDEFKDEAFEIFDATLSRNVEISYYLADARIEGTTSKSNRADNFNDLVNSYLAKKRACELLDLKVGHVVPWSKVYLRKFVINNNLKFEEIRVSNDVIFNVKAALKAKSIMAHPIQVYCVYRRLGGITSLTSRNHFLTRFNTQIRLIKLIQDTQVAAKVEIYNYLISSIAFGPATFFQAIRIIKNSNLDYNYVSSIRFDRLYRFISKSIVNFLEKRKIQSKI